MLPTPDTSHVPYERVYEPSEDSFLLLDTLSSSSERDFLRRRFHRTTTTTTTTTPLVLEVGTGSGVVISFINAHCETIFGTSAILTAGVDVNPHACQATVATVAKTTPDSPNTNTKTTTTTTSSGTYLGSSLSDLTSCFRPGVVDVLVFNPPYVPTDSPPPPPPSLQDHYLPSASSSSSSSSSFAQDSHFLALAFAGGCRGMETTDRLLPHLGQILSARGCAYILLCARNAPDAVKETLPSALGPGWRVETVGSSGKTAGWETLQVLRIWNDAVD